MCLRERPGHGWTEDEKTPALRTWGKRGSTWLQGTLRMGIPGTKHHHIMPHSWKVATCPFSSSLQASALPACLLPWLWLCSQVLCPALLLLSFIPQLVPSPCPPSHSLPPRLHSLHCTQGSQPPVYISIAGFFFHWTCCSLLPHLHWWSERFPPWEATSVFPGEVPCLRASRREQSTRLRDLNAPTVTKCYPAFFLCLKLAVLGLLNNRHAVHWPSFTKISSFLLK